MTSQHSPRRDSRHRLLGGFGEIVLRPRHPNPPGMRLPHQRAPDALFVVELRDGGPGSDGHQRQPRLSASDERQAAPLSLGGRDREAIKRSRIKLTHPHPTRPSSYTTFLENAEPSIWLGVEEEGAPETVVPAAIPDPATDPFHFQR